MGFKLDYSQSSGDHDGKLQTYSVAAAHTTLLAPGDVVRITGTADTLGVASVDASTASASVTGIVAAVVPNFEGENLTDTGLLALTAGKLAVHIDPNLTFKVAVANGPLVVTEVGLNAPLVATAATVNATNSNEYIMVSGVGLVTINLPPTPLIGQKHTVKDRQGIAASSGITIDGNGNVIDTLTTASIVVDFGSTSVIWDGGQWGII